MQSLAATRLGRGPAGAVESDQPVEEGDVLVTGPYRSADPIEP